MTNPVDDEALNPWKAALINELITCHIYTKEHDTNPRKALQDAINWNVQVALDPTVSSDAAALVESGLRSQQEPVLWQYRWFDSNPFTVTSGQWSCWEEVKPRNPYTDTVLDKVNEIQGYIDRGFKYELRGLYTAPEPPK